MLDEADKVPVVKDGKCYLCTCRQITVRGGSQVLYVAEDGTIIKKEPLHRYQERIKRRKVK